MLSYYWFDATLVVLLELICCVVTCLLLACDWFVDLILWFWCLWLCICVLVICVVWFVGCLFVFCGFSVVWLGCLRFGSVLFVANLVGVGCGCLLFWCLTCVI